MIRVLPAALLGAALLPGLAQGQPAQGVGVVTTLKGQATVTRTSLTQPLPLRFRDDVFVRDRIATAERSIVRVLLGGKALVTVRELSALTITEETSRATVDLHAGKIAMGVARQRMRPGEEVEVRTPNALAVVRGTVLVVEILRAAADAHGGAVPVTSRVHVIRGAVDVYPGPDRSMPPTRVGALQSFSRTGGAPGRLTILTPQAARQLFADLESDPQHAAATDGLLDQLMAREGDQALALALVLSPLDGDGGSPGGGAEGRAAPRGAPIIPPVGGGPGGGAGGNVAKTGRALFTLDTQTQNVAGDFYRVGNRQNVSLTQPLLETTASTLTVGQSLVDVRGTLSESAGAPFIYLDPTTLVAGSLLNLRGGTVALADTFLKDVGGAMTLGGDALSVTGASTLTAAGASPVLDLDGTTLAVAADILSTRSTVTLGGALLEGKNGTQVTAQKVASVNGALLAASAPLLSLFGGSAFTAAAGGVDVGGLSTFTSLGQVVALSASSLTIQSGNAFNLTGGGTATVAGSLFTLANGSTLTVASGTALNLGGGSALTITGSLFAFAGAGNTVSISNTLCAGGCVTIGGLPVRLSGGATLANVSITNPISNPGGGALNLSGQAAAISISGAGTTLTIQGN